MIFVLFVAYFLFSLSYAFHCGFVCLFVFVCLFLNVFPIFQGIPVIATKNASVNAEEIEISVVFFSDPDIQTFAWYVNNDKVDTNNNVFAKHSNVSVSIYGTNVSRQGYQTWILFDKKNAYDIKSLTCRLSNGVGSSEISFSLKELLLILLSENAEVTTESQGNDIYIKTKEEFEDTKEVIEN
jgi:hypothetical protein